ATSEVRSARLVRTCSVHQVGEFVGQQIDRILGEQQQQVKMNIVALEAIADFDGQSIFPALPVEPNQLVDRGMLPQHLRVPLGEHHVDLLRYAAQACTDQQAGQIEEHFQLP